MRSLSKSVKILSLTIASESMNDPQVGQSELVSFIEFLTNIVYSMIEGDAARRPPPLS